MHFGSLKNARFVIGVALLVVMGCKEAAPLLVEPNLSPRYSVSTASSEDVFRGVIFGTGVVADAVPRIRDEYKIDLIVSPELSRNYLDDLHNRIVTQVNAIDASFISSFSRAMRSGDPTIISEKLDAASHIVSQAIGQLPEGQQLDYYAANPQVLEQEIAHSLDAQGNFSLGDTLATAQDRSAEVQEVATLTYSGGGGGGGPCPPEGCPQQQSGRGGGGKSERPISPGSPQDPEAMVGPLWVAWFAGVYIVAGVHVAVVYNVAVAMAWGAWIAVKLPKRFSVDGAGLKRQMLVESIATHLAR